MALYSERRSLRAASGFAIDSWAGESRTEERDGPATLSDGKAMMGEDGTIGE